SISALSSRAPAATPVVSGIENLFIPPAGKPSGTGGRGKLVRLGGSPDFPSAEPTAPCGPETVGTDMKGSTATSRTARWASILAAFGVFALVAACGSPGSHAVSRGALQPPKLGDAPHPLARLYRQRDRLVVGGVAAYEARLRSLR